MTSKPKSRSKREAEGVKKKKENHQKIAKRKSSKGGIKRAFKERGRTEGKGEAAGINVSELLRGAGASKEL